MKLPKLDTPATESLERLLGYLNFSSGASDPQFLMSLNQVFRAVAQHNPAVGEAQRRGAAGRGAAGRPAGRGKSSTRGSRRPATWRGTLQLLAEHLDQLHESSAAFADCEQARLTIRLLQEHVVPEFLAQHRDLLFHQPPGDIVNSFLLGRIAEKLLTHALLSEPTEQIVDETLAAVNDFVGHRPVAALESQKIEPHRQEWVRPIPIYIAGAGAAYGPYERLIEPTIEMLQATPEDLLRQAYFDIEALDELAYDPRAYDFDHPQNKRPNYHFGEWDPHCIDNRGRYRRFVVREITLRALLARMETATESGLSEEELLFESAAVLAGTILMASGISGSGPGVHDSTVSLITLVPRIALYRDEFYQKLLVQVGGAHGQRLRSEAESLKQPFGGARQHLNTFLARQRAAQLQHVKLAKVFARMGYPGAAQRQSDAVPVTSARMQCRIDCALATGQQAIGKSDRPTALKNLERVVDLLQRGIACGAIVDPWNILGFQGNFSLFPAIENTVHDHRIDDLIMLVDRTIDLYARVWIDAAAADDQQMDREVESRFESFASWWNQFAAHEVPSVKAPDALHEFQAARDVAKALNQWHRSGATTGDLAFWAPHVETFGSPKAYSLVIETLLARGDLVSSMSLLVHWLDNASQVPLETRECSFHELARAWLLAVVPDVNAATDVQQSAWELLRKFFDYLEANAGEYWQVPKFRVHKSNSDEGTASSREADGQATTEDDEEEIEDLFEAAYEGVIFRDSTDDGVDGALFETHSATDSEIEAESERIVDRLSFLGGLAKLWTLASSAIGSACRAGYGPSQKDKITQSLADWHAASVATRRSLLRLMDVVSQEKLSRQGGDHQAMLDYDRRRLIKESLIEQVIATSIDASEAERLLLASLFVLTGDHDEAKAVPSIYTRQLEQYEKPFVAGAKMLAAILREDRDTTAELCEYQFASLVDEHILYVPLAKAGVPRQIAIARMRQRLIENLLVALPRIGMLQLTVRLIDTARKMERNIPAGRGAVTQFDELFAVGFREMVAALVRATAAHAGFADHEDRDADSLLVHFLEQLTESSLDSWLRHSRTLRLSVLERVRRDEEWDELVSFIENFGSDLFTQKFLMLGNVRAILHFGAENWLADQERFAEEPQLKIVEALGASISHAKAADLLSLILEAVVENYHEYRDYNSTTTQSDRGELLYTMLDFIRVRVAYDRVAWNLRPVVQAHEVLVRSGRNEAAQLWRRMLAERIGEEADSYQSRLVALQKKYAMRMASVAERIDERFLVPMTIDRMRALVEPAVEQAGRPGPHHAFEILEDETALLMREPTGSGVEAPAWLAALEDEIDHIRNRDDDRVDDALMILPSQLTTEQVEEQLGKLRKPH